MSTAEGPRYDLEALAGARRLLDWQFARFERYLGPRTVEVGAGIGSVTERLLAHGVEELLLVEPDDACSRELESRFGNDRRVRIVRETLPDSATLRAESGSFDFALCQNVLEHIEDDLAAVVTMAQALRRGGALGLLVPAHPKLYGSLDSTYGHFRRYTRTGVTRLIGSAGLELLELRSFNLLGVPGWWLKSRRGATALDGRSLAAYEAIVRIWRPFEDRIRLPWGLSLVAVARRPFDSP